LNNGLLKLRDLLLVSERELGGLVDCGAVVLHERLHLRLQPGDSPSKDC